MLETLFQNSTQQVLTKYSNQLSQINTFGQTYKNLTDLELREKTQELKKRLQNNEPPISIINESFALVREASERLSAPLVRGVTVSSCSGTDASSESMYARTHADIETMEGAAVAFVCRQRELPLLQIRAVSNWTGDRGRGEWSLGDAVDAVQRAVRRLMQP